MKSNVLPLPTTYYGRFGGAYQHKAGPIEYRLRGKTNNRDASSLDD